MRSKSLPFIYLRKQSMWSVCIQPIFDRTFFFFRNQWKVPLLNEENVLLLQQLGFRKKPVEIDRVKNSSFFIGQYFKHYSQSGIIT